MMNDTLEAPAPVEIETKRELHRYHDRCDNCGAAAFSIVTKDDKELLFCGHHLHRHESALIGQGWNIQDYTALINGQPLPKPNDDEGK